MQLPLQGNLRPATSGLFYTDTLKGIRPMADLNQTKSTGRGGYRKGAGRKPGSATKKTREIADRAAASGITPLEVMLEAMMSLRASGEIEKAASVAKDAAPYVHPKLAAIEHTGADGGAIQTENKWLVELVRADGVPPVPA
jgi:hypothetical protein